jgi:hypothetical protein
MMYDYWPRYETKEAFKVQHLYLYVCINPKQINAPYEFRLMKDWLIGV